MKKRGQIQSSIIFYILALVVMAIIFLFGYMGILMVMEKWDNSNLVKTEAEMKKDIDTMSIKLGARKTVEYSFPSRIEEVCFVKTYDGLPEAIDIPDAYPLIKESVNSGVSKNVFLLSDTVEKTFDVGEITVGGESINCIQTRDGRLSLILQGKGSHTDVSKADT